MKRILLLTLFLSTTFLGISTGIPLGHYKSVPGSHTTDRNLKNFKGHYINDRVHLEWTYNPQQWIKNFDIQRLEGNTWVSIGKLEGHANSNFDVHYSFTDYQPGNGTVQYRLKESGIEGEIVFSEPISILIDDLSNVKIYPNPVRDLIHVESNENVKFQIVDTLGNIVLHSDQANGLDMSHLPEGIYFVLLFDENDLIKSQTKVVKI